MISATELGYGESIKVLVEVENIGERTGEEVVQLYIRDEHACLVRPVKELKAYKKITLKPKEKQTVEFEITEETLKFWTANGKFETESGWFTVWVSNSSIVSDGVRFLYTK